MTRVGLSLPLSCRDRERAGQRKRQTTGYCCTLLQVHRGLIAACKSVFQNSILISCRCRMFSFLLFFLSPPTFYTQIGFGFIRLTFEALINHSKSSCNRIACGFFGCNCQLANCNANCNCQPIGLSLLLLPAIRYPDYTKPQVQKFKANIKRVQRQKTQKRKAKKKPNEKKKRQQQLSKFVHQHK